MILQNEFLQFGKEQIQKALKAIFKKYKHKEASTIIQAIEYTTLSNGKYLRPALVYATGYLFELDLKYLDPIACAIECIHTYSLIHDDLPAMDNDDLRRGLPTCHKAFGEAIAILTGDALQALAFELLAQIKGSSIKAKQKLKMIKILAKASGIQGMVGGQALDIEATDKTLSIQDLFTIYQAKTGALIKASIQLASIAGNANSEQYAILGKYADAIGLAFQIQDDILDIESNTATLGKKAQQDILLKKNTYPLLVGITEARKTLQNLIQIAKEQLKKFPHQNTDYLEFITDYIITRNY